MDELSNELLLNIFIYLDSPAPFAATCKSFRTLARDPTSMAAYLLARHGKQFALYEAISQSYVYRKDVVVERILSRGVLMNGLFFTHLIKRYTGKAESDLSFLPPDYGTEEGGMTLPAFTRLSKVFESQYMKILARNEWQAVKNVWREFSEELLAPKHNLHEQGALLYLTAPLPTGNKELSFRKLEIMLLRYQCVPYTPLDPLYERLPALCLLEPRLIALLEPYGWTFNEEVNDNFARLLLCRRGSIFDLSIFHAQPQRGTAYTTYGEQRESYLRKAPGTFFITAKVAGEVISAILLDENERSSCRDSLGLLKLCESLGLLGFTLEELFHDVLNLIHNCTLSVMEPSKIICAYPDIISDDKSFSRLPSNKLGLTKLATMLTHWDSYPDMKKLRDTTIIYPEKVVEKYYHWSKTDQRDGLLDNRPSDGLEMYVDLLCSVYANGTPSVLFALAVQDNVDSSAAVAIAAKRMVRIPSKGSTLLSLAVKFPFIVPIIREEVIRHRISLDLLEPLNSDAKDPHRPIYSHRPSFLSPIAFDYVGAKARYPLGLGPHPFVENCYFSGPIPPSDPYISESPWPAPQKEYTTTVDGKVISLGRVTGMPLERMNYESKIDREWYKSREVKGTLPVAIALLDLFKPEDEVLGIVLIHALLNLNAEVVHHYLNYGVPLTPDHIHAREKLGLPLMEAERYHVANLKKKSDALLDVDIPMVSELSRKVRRNRSRKHKGNILPGLVAKDNLTVV